MVEFVASLVNSLFVAFVNVDCTDIEPVGFLHMHRRTMVAIGHDSGCDETTNFHGTKKVQHYSQASDADIDVN